jgi:MFS family permease
MVLYGGLMGIGFVFQFLPPVLPAVIADLGISHGQAGLLVSLFALPGILLSIPAGWLADRFGERLAGSCGLALMGVATLGLARAGSFEVILAMRTLSGLGSLVGVVSLQRMTVRMFAGRPLGLPMGISSSAIPVGMVVILNVAGPVAESHGWREVAWLAGLVTTVIAAGFLAAASLLLKGELRSEPSGGGGAPPGRGYRAIWTAGAVWVMATGAMMSFTTFAPDHFRGLGLDTAARGLYTSLPMWISALLGPVVGMVADRRGGRAAFLGLGMALMTLGLATAVAPGLPPPVLGLVLGLAMSLIATPLYSMVGEVMPAAHVGRAFGILASCGNLGILVFPPVAGGVRDLTGGYLAPFLLMAALALAGVALAEVLRRGRFTPGWGK